MDSCDSDLGLEPFDSFLGLFGRSPSVSNFGDHPRLADTKHVNLTSPQIPTPSRSCVPLTSGNYCQPPQSMLSCPCLSEEVFEGAAPGAVSPLDSVLQWERGECYGDTRLPSDAHGEAQDIPPDETWRVRDMERHSQRAPFPCPGLASLDPFLSWQDGLDGFCLLLQRLTSPRRQGDSYREDEVQKLSSSRESRASTQGPTLGDQPQTMARPTMGLATRTEASVVSGQQVADSILTMGGYAPHPPPIQV